MFWPLSCCTICLYQPLKSCIASYCLEDWVQCLNKFGQNMVHFNIYIVLIEVLSKIVTLALIFVRWMVDTILQFLISNLNNGILYVWLISFSSVFFLEAFDKIEFYGVVRKYPNRLFLSKCSFAIVPHKLEEIFECLKNVYSQNLWLSWGIYSTKFVCFRR